MPLQVIRQGITSVSGPIDDRAIRLHQGFGGQVSEHSWFGLGGVNWRPGVPHILLYAGDNVGASAWSPNQDLGRPPSNIDGFFAWTTADLANWDPGTFVQPRSERGTPVHINAFKSRLVDWHRDDIDYVWVPGEGEGATPESLVSGRWEEISVPGTTGENMEWFGWERFGHIGDWWLGDPERIATSEMALEALAALDINVACIDGFTVENPLTADWYRVTADELNSGLTRPDLDPFAGPSIATQMWDWDGFSDYWWVDGENIAVEGAGISHLTGAIDDDGRNLGWALFRSGPGFSFEPVEDLAARITADVVAHAGRLGNDQKFDVGFLLDSSGSFGGAESRATQAFLALIDTLRDENRDIHVAVARFSEYGYRTHFDSVDDDRPFMLQYPMASVADDQKRAALVAALNQQAGGGGGDGPETQWEAFYQVASGAGIDANHNGTTMDSGPPGINVGSLEDFPAAPGGDYYATSSIDTPYWETLSGGLFWFPGYSGDVPANRAGRTRGTATATRWRPRVHRERKAHDS